MALPGTWNKEDILALICNKKLNSKVIRNLIENYSSLDEVLYSINENKLQALFFQEAMFDDGNIINHKLIDEQFEKANSFGAKIITFWDDNYPQLLRNIEYPPLVLFVWGELCSNEIPIISIVGTRHCSYYGRITAEKFSKYFVSKNTIVCSGLAYGIDTISHLSAVEAKGKTYAIIACGLNCISPSTSYDNAKKIVESGGAVITEYFFGTVAHPGYFPQRNRIISGVAKAVIVIESALKGGSLITARFAFDQGREVYAIPGDINSEKSKGTNMLIKKNIAAIALSPEDVLLDLGIINFDLKLIAEETNKYSFTPEQTAILNILDNKPKHIDLIIRESGLSSQEALVLLLNMEFSELIRQLPGKNYIKNI